MKTTIDIGDSLFEEVRKVAHQEETSFKAIVEASLRQFLAQKGRKRESFRLKEGSFKGRGLRDGIREGDWRQIQSLIYEGRGE